jgi:hypothetical protein
MTADALARRHTQRAIEVLEEILEDCEVEPRDRIKAADTLLCRGHGKPLEAVIQVPMTRRLAEQLQGMSDAELLEHIQNAPLPAPQREQPVLEAEIVDADARDPLLG